MTRGTRRFLIAILVVLALLNAVATVQIGESISLQLALAVSYPPLGRLFFNGFWTLLFLWLVFRLIRRPRAVIRWVPPLLTLYGSANVIWLVLFARTDFDRGRIAFQAVVTGLLLIPIWWLCRDRQPLQDNTTGSPPPSPQESPDQPSTGSPGQR